MKIVHLEISTNHNLITRVFSTRWEDEICQFCSFTRNDGENQQ